MKKVILVFALLGLTLLVSGCTTMGKRITEKDTITINNAEKIIVEASSADIEIISEERDDISVVLQTYKKGPKLDISNGKSIHIVAQQDNWLNLGLSINYSPRLTIYIPMDYNESLDVKNSSGNLSLSDLTLDAMDLDLSSGDIDADKLNFEKGIVKSSSGNIDLSNLECASLTINSHSGDLTLDNFKGELNGKSNSGNVFIGYKKLNANIDYEATSGDIIVDFNNSEIDAIFDLKCSSGNVSLDYNLDEIQLEKENAVAGTSGKGTYTVSLHATSGNITVK